MLGLTASEVQVILQQSSVIGARLEKEVNWQKLSDDLDSKKTLEYAFSGIGFTYYIHFDSMHANPDLGETRNSEQIIKDYEKEFSSLSRFEKSIVESLSKPISTVIVKNAHINKCVGDISEILSIVYESITDIKVTNYWLISKSSITQYLRYVALNVVLMLQYYVTENKERKKRGKYRKRDDLPHPELPSNHYLNLQSVSLGVRSAPDLKAAIDAAVAQSPLRQSRNEWVNAAIEEKLLRENPDLLEHPSPTEK